MKRVEPIEPPVEVAMIFVCEKCGKHVAKSGGDEDSARLLQKAIKREAKDHVGKRAIRAVMTGCHGVCPKNALTVAIASVQGPTRFVVVSAADDFERDAREIVAAALK